MYWFLYISAILHNIFVNYFVNSVTKSVFKSWPSSEQNYHIPQFLFANSSFRYKGQLECDRPRGKRATNCAAIIALEVTTCMAYLKESMVENYFYKTDSHINLHLKVRYVRQLHIRKLTFKSKKFTYKIHVFYEDRK